MRRSTLFCGLAVVLSLVFWATGLPVAEGFPIYADDPSDAYPSCCADFEQLQGQSCPNGVRVRCSWGYYGSGYCQCYYGTSWGCYSSQPIPTNPSQPLCY
jgi:hypothetical protein